MKLTAAIQEALVALLCHDITPGGATLVRGLVPARYYDPFYRELAEAAIEYLDRYGAPPGEHTLDLIESICAREPDKAPILQRIYGSIEETRAGINRAYVIQQAKTFARHQALKAGMSAAISELERGDEQGVMQAERLLRDSLDTVVENFHPGIFATDVDAATAFLESAFDAMPTGIPQMDARALGPARGKLHIFAAPLGYGKSWWLVNLAKQALLGRYKVLYVSLEMSELEVMQRLYQSLFGLTKRDAQVTYSTFERDELGRFTGLDEVTLEECTSLITPGIRGTIKKKAKMLKRRPRLLVKQFPTGSLTIEELEAYLSSLEASPGFVPDLLLIDYPDLMTTSTANYRLDVGQIYMKLRGLAIKRSMAVAAVSQLNREALNAKVSTAGQLAEDISKARTADMLVTYNQTADERALGLARLFQAKGRSDADKFTVLISQAYAIGQFAIDTATMVSTYWDHVEMGEEVDEDDD